MLTLTKHKHFKLALKMMLGLFLSLSFASAAIADGGSGGGSGGSGSSGSSGGGSLDNGKPNDATQTGAYDIREDYRRANKLSIPFGPSTKRNPDGMDEVQDRESKGPDTVDHGGPVYTWPVIIPSATSAVPTKRDKGITKHRLKTFGLPISDTQFQMIHRMDQQIMLEEMFDPERIMWLGAVMGASQVQDSSNSCANAIRNQCASAIDYVSCPIYNFTVEPGNKWNKIRDQLFMPMAVLLLLPGAMLAQVKVIVNAGMPLGGGDTSPFEGIVRSIVAIFLIPATYLVVNYGLDLNNSITYTIAHEYERIFGVNMYKDALCAVIRAFPLRQAQENRNGLYKEVVPWQDSDSADGTPASGLESRALKVKTEDPCAGEFKTDPDRADEQAPFLSVGQRFITNGSNAVLAMTWNILCAFQVVFLMYLWLIGPIVAALWVYPHETLRSAFPGWIEGVITLCFWALFWNTSVLLLACFKGVDSTGSIIISALLFLAVQSVKSAFDFAGLVKAAGDKAGEAAAGAAQHMAGNAKTGVSGGGGHRGGGGGGGGHRTSGGAAAHVGGMRGHGGGGGGHGAGTGTAASGHGAGSGAGAGAGHGGSSLAGVGGKTNSDLHVSGTISSAGSHGGTGSSGALAGHGQQGSHAGTGALTASGASGAAEKTGGGHDASTGGGGDKGMGVSSTPSAPPLSGGPELNVNNSMSSSSTSNTFNAGDLTGTVNGVNSSYSAKDAAALIGQGNLSNMPHPGQVVSAEKAHRDFDQAVRSVHEQNAKDGNHSPEAQARNDLMGNWKHMLDEADKNPMANGTLLSMPDGLPGTNAGGNWNLGAGDASAALPQGMGDVLNRVGGALNDASAAMALPGAGGTGMPVNPQAVEGLTSLAREMTQVGPELSGMSPVAVGATMEAWGQRADVLSQQLYQGGGAAMSPESYSRMSGELQQAAQSLQQFQQSYSIASGGPAMPPDSSSYGGSSATYTQSGDGGGGFQQSYAYPADQGGGAYYPQNNYQGGYYPQPDSSGGAGGSGGAGYSASDQYYNQSYGGSYGSAYSGGGDGYQQAPQQYSDQQQAYYQQQQSGDQQQQAYYQQQQAADQQQQAYYQQQQQAADQQQQAYFQQQQQADQYSQPQVNYGQAQQDASGSYGYPGMPADQGYQQAPQPADPSAYMAGYMQGADQQYQQQYQQPEYQQQYQQPEYQQQYQQPEHQQQYQQDYGSSYQQQQAHQDAYPNIPIPSSQASRAPDKPAEAPKDKPVTPPAQKPPQQQEKRMQNPLNFLKKPAAKKKKDGEEDEPPPPPPAQW